MEDKSEKNDQQEIRKDFDRQYKSFDKEQIFSTLYNAYEVDKAFYLQIPTQIRFIARKHGLPNNICVEIFQYLTAENISNHIKLLFAQAIKHCVRKRNICIGLEKLLSVLEKNHDTNIKSEIVWCLGYQIRNSAEENSEEFNDKNLIRKINSMINESENELNTTSISFLKDQIPSYRHVDNENYRQGSQRRGRTLISCSKRRPQLIVTKNQQASKVDRKDSQSQESTNRLTTINLFTNLNKRSEMSSNIYTTPVIPDDDGSDTSVVRTTYREVVYFYQRMISGQALKKKDKDEYLPSKFIGPEKKWFSGDIVASLFADRMIAAIFLEISKKQILHDNTIKLLMSCIDTLDRVEEKILGSTQEKAEIVKEIVGKNKRVQNRTASKSAINKSLKAYENDPDFVKNMARKIYDSDIIDSEELMKIISSEVNAVRLSAIETVYNSAIRKSTGLNVEYLKKIEQCRDDNDSKFQSFVIKIIGTLGDTDDVNYKNVFKSCLEKFENNENDANVDEPINYILQQSKDERRCKELFNENIISRLTFLLKKTSLNEKAKTGCCMTINNYLERNYSNGLNETQLRDCMYLINDPQNRRELKIEALKSIVLTVQKNQRLPEFVIENLVETINKFTEEFDNFVIITLQIVSQKQTILKIDPLSTKLLDDRVIVEEGVDLTFEKRSVDNSDCSSISSIVSEIFVKSLEANVNITNQSFEYLAKALDSSSDKQTRISSAKSLYLGLTNHNIEHEVLIEIRKHVEDNIPEVSNYSTIVYVKGLAKLSSAEQPIMTSHIEFLPTIYLFEDFQPSDGSFANRVNEDILSILSNEAKKQQFPDNVFQIFDHILFSKDHHQPKAIEILHSYSGNKYPIPQDTIFALENAISTREISNQVLKIFKNLIEKGQTISEKALHIFADNLYLSDDYELRKESFYELDMANDHQDISDKMFDILESERASLHICLSNPYDNNAISFLNEKTKEGQKLTPNGFEALSRIIDDQFKSNKKVLSILLNISNNNQSIPNKIIDKLIQVFDPKLVDNQLIKVFENLVNNNQNISNELLLKLEQAIDNALVSDTVLSIFISLGQKDKKLPTSVIIKILDKFPTIDKALIMQEYLSCIYSIIKIEDIFKQEPQTGRQETCELFGNTIDSRIQKTLIHALKKGDSNVVSKCVDLINTLISFRYFNLRTDSIDALIDVSSSTVCDKNLKEKINILLSDHPRLDENQKQKLRLSNLNDGSKKELINQLKEFSQTELLEQNFHQINFMINSCPDLISKALNVLLGCPNKKDIPKELLNTITFLSKYTSKDDIKDYI